MGPKRKVSPNYELLPRGGWDSSHRTVMSEFDFHARLLPVGQLWMLTIYSDAGAVISMLAFRGVRVPSGGHWAGNADLRLLCDGGQTSDGVRGF